MTATEKKINALASFVMAKDEESREIARKALQAALKLKTEEITVPDDAEQAIHDFLSEIGAPPHILGYRYAVYGILLALNHPEILDNITCRFYPDIAVKFDTTAYRVERAIRNLVESTFAGSDMDLLLNYFGNVVKPNSGKPTNACFIARSAIILKSRLKK